MDLLLPPLLVLSDYQDESGDPRPKFAQGFFGNVRFTPWQDFDAVIQSTADVLNSAPPELTNPLVSSLQRCRDQIDPQVAARQNEPFFKRDAAELPLDPEDFREPQDCSYCHGDASFARNRAQLNGSKTLKDIAHTGCLVFTDWSSVEHLNFQIFMALEGLTQVACRARMLFLQSQRSPSSEFARKYDVHDGPADFGNLTPGYALFSSRHNPHRLPYCSVALTGPLRQFWEVTTPNTTQEEESGRASCDLCTEVHPFKRTQDDTKYSAEALADFYNSLFSDGNILTDADLAAKRRVFLLVAETLTQGLLTVAGYCVLYNYQEAVAFKLDKACVDGKESLLVHVSRAYPCDRAPGSVAALLGILRESASSGQNIERRKEIRSLCKLIADASVRWKLSNKKEASGAERSSPGSQKEINGVPSKRQKVTKGEAVPPMPSSISTADCIPNWPISLAGDGYSNEENIVFISTLSTLMRANRGVIGSGSGSFVLGSRTGGQDVAIKTWNQLKLDGLECIINEVIIYRYLHASNANVLGECVPNWKMGRIHPMRDAVLVIDYVGKAVYRDADEEMVVGEGKEAAVQDIESITEIGKAAIRSLRSLHQCGILHGSIGLRNLRAEQKSTEAEVRSNVSWHVWWIDLGRAEKGKEGMYGMDHELGECCELFFEVDRQVILSAV